MKIRRNHLDSTHDPFSVYNIFCICRILVCAPSNAAVDALALKIIHIKKNHQGSVIGSSASL